MWVYLPRSLMSACSPEQPASTLPSESLCQRLSVSASWRTTSRRSGFWSLAWKKGVLNRLQSSLIFASSRDNGSIAELISSSADFHAPICPWPEDKPVSTENTAACGSSTSGSFATLNPDGSLSRMCPQLSLIQLEESYSEGLPDAGSMRSGYL